MKKTKFSHRAIALTLFLVFLPSLLPINYVLASNNGPNAPEAASFEPVDATDMVNLVSGDVSYVLPLLDMDGFPLTLSYHAGVPLDMESSWTGLGWNVNAGAISRSISGTPDDWLNGKSLDFIYFQDSEEFYNINVGVGLSQTAEVGVGISWGSNKSLSGSVYGSFAGAGASIATDGGYSLGYGIGAGKGSYGGSLSVGISGNVNGGGTNVGIGVGGGKVGGAYGSLGYSLTDNSVSLSGGFSNKTSYDKGQAGGGGLSMGNYSAGDYDISSKGFFVPIQIWIFNLSFGYRKVTYQLDKGYPKSGYGSLYSGLAGKNPIVNNDPNNQITDNFVDFQDRYQYTDLYEQQIPSTAEEFITDYQTEREKVNFGFASYDSYSVNATGISGEIQPKIFENASLYGLGYSGPDTDESNKNMRVYYHNGGSTSRSFGTSTQNNSTDIKFYFNGQFTENVTVPNRELNSLSGNTFQNYLNSGANSNMRQRSGNFVEVFTNQQMATGNTTKIMYPDNTDYANWPQDGIGAYKITAPDGKTYHYSLPVYHFEQVERNLIKDNSQNHVNEKRQYSPYATHWLLTAITGPDYVDVNNDNKPDKDDYGYWVSMDYGKWSDGFVWRSPYKGKKYNTNLAGDIEEKDFGNYQYGRKQLYYLDKIVTREHTAYFVKDLRYDSTGAHGNNEFSNANTTTYQYSFDGNTTVENGVIDNGSTSIVVQESINYKREYQLLLDKIIVTKNEGSFESTNKNPTLSLDNTNCFPGYDDDLFWGSQSLNFNPNGGFKDEYGLGYGYGVHQEQNVYDVTDFTDFDYSKALKVIDLTYSYALARNSPSSIFCNGYGGGRLTLTGVYFNGKENKGYMPPYRFAYKNEMDYPEGLYFNKYYPTDYLPGQAKDGWGFIDEVQVAEEIYNSSDYEKYGPDNWSLKEIKTPTGGKIKLEYEEDDYEQEAFSRKLWQDNLQITVRAISGLPDAKVEIYIQNIPGLRPEQVTDFSKYFENGKEVFLDLWIQRTIDNGLFSADAGGAFDLRPEFDFDVVVKEVKSDNTLVLEVATNSFPESYSNDYPWLTGPPPNVDIQQYFQAVTVVPTPQNPDVTLYFAKSDIIGSGQYQSFPRGHWIGEIGNGDSSHNMSYRLLANKVPKDVQGGGLRAKSIIVSDDLGREYKTNYYYNKPGTPREKDNPNYKSSGITSFAPENGIKFIPYQSELPSPGVMYEYVTMVPVSGNGNELQSTRYRFHTLNPVFNLFDPNLKMEYESEKIDENTGQPVQDTITIFESKVADAGSGGYFDANNKTYGKTVDLKLNTSLVGQFRSIESFNNEGHLMSKTQKYYDNAYQGIGQPDNVILGRGSVQESFQNMKSVFQTNNNDDPNSMVLKDRYISISSKEEFSTVLNEVRTTTGGFTTSEKYLDADLQTGAFATTETTKADGTLIRTRNIPAYTQYSGMGSKVDDINNKHMITQRAMAISDIYLNGTWKTNAASINTWRNKSIYDDGDLLSTTNDGIWRKHSNFIWKDDVDADGTFGVQLSSSDFNWGENATQTNSQWQKISETTRYNHWSSPLEVKDINDNFLATKMGDLNKKVYATGNASYNEIFYSGAEDWDAINSTFGGQVGIGDATEEPGTSNIHTGKKSLKLESGQTGFTVNVNQGKRDEYKVSIWTKHGSHQNLKIKVGTSTPYISHNTEEEVRAGEWIQLNYYFQVIGEQTIAVINESGTAYIDDFRLHPVASSMTSYVYNEFDELTHILGANNMATEYKYDEGGRLYQTWTEVEDFNGPGTGGFKKINENKYTYKY
ncbi:hypothetical protein PP182_19835 [Maribacter sp. PR1]|uniref:Uncharacterized protein n=1 Tax=Maribacter cobaltidurans TaxID=1178778 RepID=A0ABU7IZC6_9FLAO|nr:MULTISPECIES: hypothetical protein [Maribacter]MDC6390947.1 hypothetical protein [Maribacter sp. PR1]MEE1978339.1 hypothetical protein [Maribacter cobaltidurans]